jgi:hypothetical protein
MAMTRARDLVYILTESKWPKELNPIKEKVVWIDHDI